MKMEEKYILALDVGTTTIRSFIFNRKAEIVGEHLDEIVLYYSKPGYVEIDPDDLWKSVISVVQKSLYAASLSAGQITGMGISTQRSTFLTWSRETGNAFHKFITWKDMRAEKLVKEWNESYLLKCVRGVAYILFLLSRMKRLKVVSGFKFMNTQTLLRLYWALQNNSALKVAVEKQDAMFGTLDTWLLYKLTGGTLHVTDVSCVSVTGFFDPFIMDWGQWALRLFNIPLAALPKIVDTAGDHFTKTDIGIWGHEIPIISSMADQTASMWGSCCFNEGDIKLTLGTGTFINVNSGSQPHAGLSGIYPVVGWRVGNELYHVAEGANNDTATIITWSQKMGLFEDPSESERIANSVTDSDGVFFIPAFSGLGPPINDGAAATGFIGIKPTTTKAHLVRAILESLTFRVVQLYNCIREEIPNRKFHLLRLDGGVSNNSFIAQLIADLTGLRVERPAHVEMTALGCAHIVGLQLGIWKSKQELESLRKVGAVFNPREDIRKTYQPIFNRWLDAVERMRGWYENGDSTDSSVISSRNSINLSSTNAKEK